ncbi:MAG TPA: iron dependent repressor, metal binding and dimerization domain protein, partial [Phycisphaerales bacterium]|nr:iron dependent repressor, metal binding and dimerization domain protein [Phycisphaerales bacterium]
GIVVRLWKVWRLNRRVAMQHILRAMFEVSSEDTLCNFESIANTRSWPQTQVKRLLSRLERHRFATRKGNCWSLTALGMAESKRVVRNHRLWETYLINFADIAPNHVDRDADMIEHVLGTSMVEKLEALLGNDPVTTSPHPLGERG